MRRLLCILALGIPMFAQPIFRHSFAIGGGAAWPRYRSTDSWNRRPALLFSYGYRLHRFMQLDAGFETISGFARREIEAAEQYAHVKLGTDRLYSVPAGARFILPLAEDRFHFAVGAGALYERYTGPDRPGPPVYFSLPRRSGWGGYALASTSAALDRRQHLRAGATARMNIVNAYGPYSQGDQFGRFAGRPLYRDRWLTLAGEFGVSF